MKRRWRILIRNRPALISASFLAIVALMVVFPRLFSHYGLNEFVNQEGEYQEPLLPPSRAHPFGTDELGRDLYSRVVHGTRTSFLSGLAVVALTGVTGTIVGMVAASQGELIDDLLMRASDIFLAFPPLVIAIVFIGFLGPGLQNALLALILIRWPQYARLSRGITLSTLQSGYIEASRAMGASWPMLYYQHVLPNSLSPIIIKGSLDLGETILITGALSFLGLGVQPPTPELGALVTQGRDYILTAWWYSTFPGLMIFLIVLALNFIGDGIREMLDPTTMISKKGDSDE